MAGGAIKGSQSGRSLRKRWCAAGHSRPSRPAPRIHCEPVEEVRSELRVIEVTLAPGDTDLAIVVAEYLGSPRATFANRELSRVTFAILAAQAPRLGDTITAAVQWGPAE
jgi:hypothetical protein